MTQPSNFITKVFRKDKKIKISTVSPNGKFFYKIKEPKDLYWGLFCSLIAFFDMDENLMYFNKAQFAQFGLTKTKEWEVVSWSLSGNFAFFIERNSTQSLKYILLDLINKTVSKTEFQGNYSAPNLDIVAKVANTFCPDFIAVSIIDRITAKPFAPFSDLN